MAFILALIFFGLMVINMIYNIFIEKYASGLEALLVMGITAIGIYLSWYVMSSSIRGKK